MVDYKTFDPDLWAAIAKEEERQEHNLELIASENFVSEAVMAAQGSILTNKYVQKNYSERNLRTSSLTPALKPTRLLISLW